MHTDFLVELHWYLKFSPDCRWGTLTAGWKARELQRSVFSASGAYSLTWCSICYCTEISRHFFFFCLFSPCPSYTKENRDLETQSDIIHPICQQHKVVICQFIPYLPLQGGAQLSIATELDSKLFAGKPWTPAWLTADVNSCENADKEPFSKGRREGCLTSHYDC